MRKKKHSCDAGEALRDVSAESRVLRNRVRAFFLLFCLPSKLETAHSLRLT